MLTRLSTSPFDAPSASPPSPKIDGSAAIRSAAHAKEEEEEGSLTPIECQKQWLNHRLREIDVQACYDAFLSSDEDEDGAEEDADDNNDLCTAKQTFHLTRGQSLPSLSFTPLRHSLSIQPRQMSATDRNGCLASQSPKTPEMGGVPRTRSMPRLSFSRLSNLASHSPKTPDGGVLRTRSISTPGSSIMPRTRSMSRRSFSRLSNLASSSPQTPDGGVHRTYSDRSLLHIGLERRAHEFEQQGPIWQQQQQELVHSLRASAELESTATETATEESTEQGCEHDHERQREEPDAEGSAEMRPCETAYPPMSRSFTRLNTLRPRLRETPQATESPGGSPDGPQPQLPERPTTEQCQEAAHTALQPESGHSTTAQHETAQQGVMEQRNESPNNVSPKGSKRATVELLRHGLEDANAFVHQMYGPEARAREAATGHGKAASPPSHEQRAWPRHTANVLAAEEKMAVPMAAMTGTACVIADAPERSEMAAVGYEETQAKAHAQAREFESAEVMAEAIADLVAEAITLGTTHEQTDEPARGWEAVIAGSETSSAEEETSSARLTKGSKPSWLLEPETRKWDVTAAKATAPSPSAQADDFLPAATAVEIEETTMGGTIEPFIESEPFAAEPTAGEVLANFATRAFTHVACSIGEGLNGRWAPAGDGLGWRWAQALEAAKSAGAEPPSEPISCRPTPPEQPVLQHSASALQHSTAVPDKPAPPECAPKRSASEEPAFNLVAHVPAAAEAAIDVGLFSKVLTFAAAKLEPGESVAVGVDESANDVSTNDEVGAEVEPEWPEGFIRSIKGMNPWSDLVLDEHPPRQPALLQTEGLITSIKGMNPWSDLVLDEHPPRQPGSLQTYDRTAALDTSLVNADAGLTGAQTHFDQGEPAAVGDLSMAMETAEGLAAEEGTAGTAGTEAAIACSPKTLATLRDNFPDLDTNSLHAVLDSCSGNVEVALELLFGAATDRAVLGKDNPLQTRQSGTPPRVPTGPESAGKDKNPLDLIISIPSFLAAVKAATRRYH